MNKEATIEGTTEAWESGALGASLEHARVASPELTAEIDAATGLQMISIRLPKSVVEDFKFLAQIEGIGYQPLMRTALMRFAECESKRVMREHAAEVEAARKRKAQKDAQAAEQKKAA